MPRSKPALCNRRAELLTRARAARAPILGIPRRSDMGFDRLRRPRVTQIVGTVSEFVGTATCPSGMPTSLWISRGWLESNRRPQHYQRPATIAEYTSNPRVFDSKDQIVRHSRHLLDIPGTMQPGHGSGHNPRGGVGSPVGHLHGSCHDTVPAAHGSQTATACQHVSTVSVTVLPTGAVAPARGVCDRTIPPWGRLDTG
jgi:hypothetical protein